MKLIILSIKLKTKMRKTSQSMYQSNLKTPITASKVIDGSNLFKSSGTIPRTKLIM